MMVSICCAVIIALIGIICLLVNTIVDDRRENERYYRNLRRTYEIQLDNLTNDIRVRDEIIRAWRIRYEQFKQQ